MSFHDAPMPTPGQQRWYKVKTCSVQKPTNALILSKIWVGQWTHWEQTGTKASEGVTLYCTDDENCHRCKAGMNNKWYAYLAIYEVDLKEERIECVSYNAACYLKDLAEQYGTLRGLQVLFTRAKKVTKDGKLLANGKVDGRLIQKVDEGKVPAEFDVKGSLNRLWGINGAFWEKRKYRKDANIVEAGRPPSRPRFPHDDNDGRHVPLA